MLYAHNASISALPLRNRQTSALVLPQHILTNPFYTARRYSPLTPLLAFDTRFVDQPVNTSQSVSSTNKHLTPLFFYFPLFHIYPQDTTA